MTFRKWDFKDILRISELEKECFPSDAWTYKTFVSAFETDAFCGILIDDGDIAGYGAISVAGDSADIETIAVAERYRGSGLGTQLLQKLLSAAVQKGAKKIFLEVRVSNRAAMSLYLKCGFTGVYARTRYYPDGEDCLVMAKDL